MTPDEIRNLNLIAARSWESPDGLAEQVFNLTSMVQEVAAQLAEANTIRRAALAKADEKEAAIG